MQTDLVFQAADRMYDAIRQIHAAKTPGKFNRAVKVAKQAADDYDAAISQVELDERQRSRIRGLRPHDAGRN